MTEFKVGAHHRLILRKRYTCMARTPRCGSFRIKICVNLRAKHPTNKPKGEQFDASKTAIIKVGVSVSIVPKKDANGQVANLTEGIVEKNPLHSSNHPPRYKSAFAICPGRQELS